jgi:hypothetical protein
MQTSGMSPLLYPSWSSLFPRPANYKERFNLQHAQAQNVVERIFGVVNAGWEILTHAP